jgi:hypothetical protein
MSDAEPQAHHLSFGAICPKCKHTQPPLTAVSSAYFQGQTINCRNIECKEPIDYWKATLDFIGGEGIPTLLLVSVGAHETTFDFPLWAGDIAPIDLTTYGIPLDATLLDISFTSYGTNCVAQLLHSHRVSLRSLPIQFNVYGFGTGEGDDLKGYVEATVAWVQKGEDNVSWSYLLDAFEAMASHRWRGVILPAYAAFEIGLSPLVLNALGKHVNQQSFTGFQGRKVLQFFICSERSASYSLQGSEAATAP